MKTIGYELPLLCDGHAGAMWAWLRGFARSSGELPSTDVLYEEIAFLGRRRCGESCRHLCEAPAIVGTQRKGMGV